MKLKDMRNRSKRLLATATVWAFNELERRFRERDILNWTDIKLGSSTSSGVTVNQETALTYVTVYACVNLLSRTMASLPLNVYERISDKERRRATDHYLYRVLHLRPNPEMTSYKWRETTFAHILLWGNAYSEIVYDGAGRVRELWPIHPSRVTPKRNKEGQVVYEIRLPDDVGGQTIVLPKRKMLHFKGLGPNGIEGYSVISLASEAIGLGLAAQEYSARFFSNDSTPAGFLSHPQTLGPEGIKNVKASWTTEHGGLENSHKVAVLEEGMKWEAMGIPAKDAQLIESRKFSKEEIATLFGIPQHMVGNMDRATFSNIEHQGIEYVVHSVRPWAVNMEQEMVISLIMERNWDRYFIEHDVNGLLRGDTESRFKAYGQARRDGWMNANEIRALENFPPLEGDQGNVYIVQKNMANLELIAAEQSIAASIEEEFNNVEEGTEN